MARYDDEEEKGIIGSPEFIARPGPQMMPDQMGGAGYEALVPERGRAILKPLVERLSGRGTGLKVPTQDLTQGIIDKTLTRQDDYATRAEGRTRPSSPVVPPSSLESVWGIGKETLPTGAARYTVPGEGIMTAEPETAATRREDETARRGVVSRIDTETAERERGAETELSNIERLREEGIQRQRYEEGTAERQRRQDLGLEPKLGYAAYEEAGKRMREGVIPPKERAAIEVARIGAVSEAEKARLTSEGVVSAAGIKSQTEAAKLGIQAADVKSKMQLRQAQMDKMLTETGLLAPMKLKLEGAKDAVSRTKIQRDTYETANKQIYDKTTKALQDKFNMGQIDAVTYDTELNALTKGFAERQDMIADKHAMEGQVHSTGVAVMRNGIWVDLEKGKK
ncbi:MAG: hypothetical protein IMZ43_09700 [Thermoplasmata archaeon]|nr:hypothetical protein [Thermoplasmata archaeon]